MPGGVELSEFPAALARQFGISEYAGNILASAIAIAFFVFPTLFLQKKYNFSPIISILMGFVIMGFCTAVGWLDIFFMLLMCMITALMFSGKMRDLISGG